MPCLVVIWWTAAVYNRSSISPRTDTWGTLNHITSTGYNALLYRTYWVYCQWWTYSTSRWSIEFRIICDGGNTYQGKSCLTVVLFINSYGLCLVVKKIDVDISDPGHNVKAATVLDFFWCKKFQMPCNVWKLSNFFVL